jgi:hypothetical protein
MLAEAQSINGHIRKEKILRQLIILEHQRAMLRKIKFVLGKVRQGVTAIESPNQLGDWELQTTKELIEIGCINENKRRFTQANGTPPVHQDQVELIGWMADTPVATEILMKGSSDSTNLHPSIRKMTKYFEMPENLSSFENTRTHF